MKFLKTLFASIIILFLLSACSFLTPNSEKLVKSNESTKSVHETSENDSEEETTDHEDENQVEPEENEEIVEENHSNDDSEVYIEYEGIAFKYPDILQPYDWIDEATGYKIIFFEIDPEQVVSINIVVEPLPIELTLDEYMLLATSTSGFDYISIENYSENGLDWNQAISMNGDIKLNQRTVMNTDTNVVYTFTYGSLPEAYDEYLDMFIKLTESVELLGE